jgi:hypothetical protein
MRDFPQKMSEWRLCVHSVWLNNKHLNEGASLKHRKILLAAATSFLLACAGLLAGASSASAAVSPSTIWITSCPNSGAIVIQNAATGGSNVTSVAYTSTGDSLKIENTCGAIVDVQLGTGGSFAAPASVFPGGITVLLNSSGYTQLRFSKINSTTTFVTLVFGGSGGGGGSSDSTAFSSAPSPVFQQFGKPSSGTCDAAAPATLNWSGVTSGGWSESWAQWMNGGNGGAVCTRTLVYSTAQSRWVVG